MSHYFLLNIYRDVETAFVLSIMITPEQRSTSGSRYRFGILCNYTLLRYYWHHSNMEPNNNFPKSSFPQTGYGPKRETNALASGHFASESKVPNVKRGKEQVIIGTIQNLLLGCLFMVAIPILFITYYILTGLSSMYRTFWLSAW